jgi:hypothetical protein
MKRLIILFGAIVFFSCHSANKETLPPAVAAVWPKSPRVIVINGRPQEKDTLYLYVGYNAAKTGSNHTVYGYFIQWWTEYPTMSQIKKQIRKSDKSIKGLKLIVLSVIQLTKDQVKNLSE